MIDLLIMAIGLLLVVFQTRLKFNLDLYVKLFLLLFIVSVVCFSVSRIVYDGQSNPFGYFGDLYMPMAFAFVVMHSYSRRGAKQTLIMFSITISFGLVSELLGVKFGWIFGKYHYGPGAFFFGLVPLMTPVSWAIIIYMAYSMTSIIVPKTVSAFLRPGHPKPFAIPILLAVLSSIDGLVAMNLDLILDPVSVDPHIAGWVWIDGGPYYGVPISNFAGWFFVTFFATLVFRSYESVLTEPCHPTSQHDYYPAAVYFSYFVIHAAVALSIGHSELILIGIGTMMPFCIIATYRYLWEFTATNLSNLDKEE